jgi:putative aminopeptidase FrvX
MWIENRLHMESKKLMENQAYQSPQVGAAQLDLLERLCNACAVTGEEREVRAIVLEQLRLLLPPEQIKMDAMGNVLAVRPGQGPNRLRVMLAAHMDEVGFMLVQDDGEGIFRFENVGGVDSKHLAAKPVWVGRDHIPGVIGINPIHLTTSEERKRAISPESLRIDVGPANSARPKVGDRAVYATHFRRQGPSLIAKALDDRLGVATLLELLRMAPANVDLLAAFTVQEEIGLRGAGIAAYALDPQLAIVLDCTPALDLPLWESGDDRPVENTRYNARLGSGPAIYLVDRATISDPRLVRHLVDTAEQLGIPYQFRQAGGGGTDAGTIHRARAGIPSVSVSVPARYLHTPASIARLSDWENSLALVHAALSRLTPEILNQER